MADKTAGKPGSDPWPNAPLRPGWMAALRNAGMTSGASAPSTIADSRCHNTPATRPQSTMRMISVGRAVPTR
jgi:hypothetical protein